MPQVLYQVDKNQCYAMGGFPSQCANTGYGPANVCVCTIPDPPAPAPVQQAPANVAVNVNPSIAVSPQISPSFVQQMQPSNSPVTTGAAMTGSGGATSSTPTMATAQPAAVAPAQATPAPTATVPINSGGVPLPAVPAYTPPATGWSSGDSTGGAITYATSPNYSTPVVSTGETVQPDRTMLYAGMGAAALLMLFLLTRKGRK